MKTRILLADDHRLFREGIAALINARQDMETVGGMGASDGKEAIRLAIEFSPDVAFLDVGMPILNGIEAARILTASCPRTKIIGLSGHGEHRLIVDMLRAGASGYVLKNSPFEELVAATHAVVGGKTHIDPEFSGDLIMELVRGVSPGATSAFSLLTNRELEIVQAIAEGKSTKEIACALSISVKTVETHRQQIMDKLGVHGVAELTRYAIREEIAEA